MYDCVVTDFCVCAFGMQLSPCARAAAEAEAPADDWEAEADDSAAAASSKKDKKKKDKKSKGTATAAAAEDAEDIDAILGASSAAAAAAAADNNDDEAAGDDDELAKAMASGQTLTKAQQKRLRKKQASADPTQARDYARHLRFAFGLRYETIS